MATLTSSAVQSAVDARHWRVVLGAVHATFRTGSFVRGLELVRRLTEAAEAANHHPDVDLRYPRVHVALSSHDVHGLTQRDVDHAPRVGLPPGW